MYVDLAYYIDLATVHKLIEVGLLYMYMLGAKYGFGLSADFLRKPVIRALRSKSEVRADNPRIVLSNAQTFAPHSARGSRRQSSDCIYLVLRRPSLRSDNLQM